MSRHRRRRRRCRAIAKFRNYVESDRSIAGVLTFSAHWSIISAKFLFFSMTKLVRFWIMYNG